ncbi:MAG: hypothetical protein ACOC16_00930 [Nanoarchaeota archaeon]
MREKIKKQRTKNQKTEEINYYKITTFILVFFLVILCGYIFYSINIQNIATKNQEYGRQQTLNNIIANIEQNQQVTIHYNQNDSVTLIPISLAYQVREDTILEIIDYIEKEGVVSLYNNETKFTLIPYNSITNQTS